jgi:hypothetical protein
METKLTITLIIVNIIFMLFVYSYVRKNKIMLKYAILWWIASIILIFCALTPNLVLSIANFIGIQTASNMIFLIIIGILLAITFTLTSIISNQKTKITYLIEEISILKRKIFYDK